jgi:type I restriction enzyme S subunit
MHSNSPDVALGDVADLLTGHPFKSEHYSEKPGDIRLVRGDNIVQGAMRWDGVKRWPASQANNFERYQLREGDVVLAMDRPWIDAGLKYASISKHDLPCLLVQRTTRMRGGANLDTRYLKYVIGSEQFTQHIQAITTGTAVPHISLKQIKDFRFKLPHLAEQKRIANILGALDDKIELNRKMNVTLEQIARALFKSWFVDFEPIHCRAASRRPAGMDKAIADLFPDNFVDSELGKIPHGWRIGTLFDISEFSRESVNPSDGPSEVFDHYSLPSFDEGKAPKPEAGSNIKSNKLTVTNNCVLLSKLNPHIPRIWLPALHASRRSICSTEFIVASARNGCTREYLYELFQSDNFSKIYRTLVTGTTGSHQRIRAESVLQVKQVIPPTALIGVFTQIVAPLLSRVAFNITESQRISEMKNAMTPVLISGRCDPR